MKYDDASWHYGGDFPADLPQAAGATHIGMFLAWLIRNDYASQELIEEAEDRLGVPTADRPPNDRHAADRIDLPNEDRLNIKPV